MAAAFRPKLRPPPLHPRRRLLCSASSDPDPPPSESTGAPAASSDDPQSPTKVSISSYFSDIKSKLRSPPVPPRHTSVDEIRQNLANFSLRSSSSPGAKNPPNPSTLSFNEIFSKSSSGLDRGEDGSGRFSFDSILGSLRNVSSSRDRVASPFSLRPIQGGAKPAGGATPEAGVSGIRESILGREEETSDAKDGLKLGFARAYSYEELGEKLGQLKGVVVEDGKGEKEFSLQDLGQLLVKFQETEATSMAGLPFKDLRDSLLKVGQIEKTKKQGAQNLSLLVSLGKQATPSYMLMPPQEQLVERYFHPDHMPASEKMKLELKRVRDEFKMSESDCGSARVQVAQLTTKIKYLSAVLHKKDKHSRKGLQEMVQQRKKILKYLRRTDWESYCFILSKFGLRDVPEYKAPDYKSMRKAPSQKKKQKA